MAFTSKKNYVLFISLSGIGVLFSILSVLLIIRVNAIRENVEGHVANVNTLSRLEAETFSVFSTIENGSDQEIKRQISNLISFPEIPVEYIDFTGLQKALKKTENNKDKSDLLYELSLLKKSCQYAIGQNRQQLRSNSEKLLHYWNYTHVLLILASSILLTLPLIIYKLTKVKKDLLH